MLDSQAIASDRVFSHGIAVLGRECRYVPKFDSCYPIAAHRLSIHDGGSGSEIAAQPADGADDYVQRTQSETVRRMVKRNMGQCLRSVIPRRQRPEVELRSVAHNLMLGRPFTRVETDAAGP